MRNNEPRYTKALLDDGTLCNIEDLSEGDREASFSCISCGKRLVPRLGDIRAHHFYHFNSNAGSTCSPETYLHEVAKRELYSHLVELDRVKAPYQSKLLGVRSKSIVRTPESWLNVGMDYVCLDLLEDCVAIKLEKVYEQFRPDDSLHYRDGSVTMLEIFVSLKSARKKISTERVVEFKVERENDILRILTGAVEVPDSFFGFDHLRPTSTLLQSVNSPFQNRKVEQTSAERRVPRQLLDGPPPSRHDILSGKLPREIEEESLRTLVQAFNNGQLEIELDVNIASYSNIPAWLQLNHWYSRAEIRYLSGRPYCILLNRLGRSNCVISYEENLIKYIDHANKSVVLKPGDKIATAIQSSQILSHNFTLPTIDFGGDQFTVTCCMMDVKSRTTKKVITDTELSFASTFEVGMKVMLEKRNA